MPMPCGLLLVPWKIEPPSTDHVWPPSMDWYSPTPLLNSDPPSKLLPVPAYTMLGFPGSRATAPIESDGRLSVSGVQDVPPLVVFQTPPSLVTMYTVWSLVPRGSIAMS